MGPKGENQTDCFYPNCFISNLLAYWKSGTQDPQVGPGTRDPGPLGGTPYGGTLMWDPKVGPQGENQADCFYPNCFIPSLLGCFLYVGFNKLRITGV